MLAHVVKADNREFIVRIDGADDMRWQFSEEFSPSLQQRAISNFLLRSSYAFAMRKGRDLEVEMPIDRMLAVNLMTFGEMWANFRPDVYLRPSRIIAPEFFPAASDRTRSDEYVAAFSGGIDSSFLIKSCCASDKMGAPIHPIGTAVMINGLGFGRDSDYDMTFRAGQEYCNKFGVKLLAVKTNWKAATRHYEMFHTLGISAVLGLLQDRFSGGYIALDFSYSEEFALGSWGNLSATTPLFRSSDFDFLPYGGQSARAEKIRDIATAGHDTLVSVCNARNRSTLNCGVCEKCIRTMLFYRAMDLELPPKSFLGSLSLERVSSIEINKKTQAIFFRSLEREWINRDDVYLTVVQGLLRKADREKDLFSNQKAQTALSRQAKKGVKGNLAEKNAKLEREIEKIKRVAQKHKAANTRLKRHAEYMTSSKSWKLTAPLRKLYKSLHRRQEKH